MPLELRGYSDLLQHISHKHSIYCLNFLKKRQNLKAETLFLYQKQPALSCLSVCCRFQCGISDTVRKWSQAIFGLKTLTTAIFEPLLLYNTGPLIRSHDHRNCHICFHNAILSSGTAENHTVFCLARHSTNKFTERKPRWLWCTEPKSNKRHNKK